MENKEIVNKIMNEIVEQLEKDKEGLSELQEETICQTLERNISKA